MATETLKVGGIFPVGTSVSAYEVSSYDLLPRSGVTGLGSAVAIAAVASGSLLTFTGLTENQRYLAYASVSGSDKYLRFSTLDDPASAPVESTGGVPDGGATGQTLVKLSDADGDAEWGDTAALSDDAPLAPGTPSAGVDGDAARADHVHAPPDIWLPDRQGFKAWTIDPAACTNQGVALTAGWLVGWRVPIRRSLTISDVSFYVTTAGNTLGVSKVGIYALDGTLIAQSADQAANWTSTGLKTVAVTAESGQTLTRIEDVLVVFSVASATSTLSIQRGQDSSNTAFYNAGLASPALRSFVKSGTAALPSTLSSVQGTALAAWIALS